MPKLMYRAKKRPGAPAVPPKPAELKTIELTQANFAEQMRANGLEGPDAISKIRSITLTLVPKGKGEKVVMEPSESTATDIPSETESITPENGEKNEQSAV